MQVNEDGVREDEDKEEEVSFHANLDYA